MVAGRGTHGYILGGGQPKLLHQSAFWVQMPTAERMLNRLQEYWALKLLGCSRASRVRGMLAVAQSGWTLRLGSRMLERAVMLRARIKLLPCSDSARPQ